MCKNVQFNSSRTMNSSEKENEADPGFDPWNESNLGMDECELQRLLDDPVPQQDSTSLRRNQQHEGFDVNAGDTWIYPSNLPCRAYQKSITQAALYNNTLVVLPTGLGKTFIAAVVMYNFYRWYPTGKIIFMAPTRPLVAQQIEACQKLMPFPDSDVVELTGKLQRNQRVSLWREKKIFFATPQAVHSDILSSITENAYFPFAQIKLLVFDEAHRAKGRYAYTEVAQIIHAKNMNFRVLALSATPGRTVDDVAAIAHNLFISHLEVRSDSAIDVMPYIHKRNLKTIVVPLSDEIKQLLDELEKILDPYIRQLIDSNVIRSASVSKNALLFEHKRFKERSLHESFPDKSAVNTNFSICISLLHSMELLERHGLRVFLTSFENDEDGRQKFIMTINPRLNSIVETLRENIGMNPLEISTHAMTNGRIPRMPQNLDFGHPKFEEARKCLLEHFQSQPESRAIIFCEYRESVLLIYRLLLQHEDLLKPRCFVGQGGTTGALRALTQKQQMQIMSDFRCGKSNVLVATSIGEEGIDVGEVDLIVCFDISTTNPTRFVQRIGRTGRRRSGQVIMLVTEGREQKLLKEVLSAKDQVNGRLKTSPIVNNALYQHSPRLVPTEFNPKCLETFIQLPEKAEKKETKKVAQTKKRVRPVKASAKPTKPLQNTQDLRNFFKGTQSFLSTQVRDIFDARNTSTQELEPITQNSAEKSLNKIKKHFRSFNFEEANEELQTSDSRTEKLQQKRKDETTLEKETVVDPKAKASHFKKVNKILRSRTSLLTQSQRSADFYTQLKCEYFSRQGKLSLLKANTKLVREICDQMSILEAIEVDPSASMCQEERDIRERYEEFMKLFDDREELQEFLERSENENTNSRKKVAKEDDQHDLRFQSALDKIFRGLGPPKPYCDNFEFKQEQLKDSEAYNHWLEQMKNESLTRNSIAYSIYDNNDSTMQTHRFDDTPHYKGLSGAKCSGSLRRVDMLKETISCAEEPSTSSGAARGASGRVEVKNVEKQKPKEIPKSCEVSINLISDDDDDDFMKIDLTASEPSKDTKSFTESKTNKNSRGAHNVDDMDFLSLKPSTSSALMSNFNKQNTLKTSTVTLDPSICGDSHVKSAALDSGTPKRISNSSINGLLNAPKTAVPSSLLTSTPKQAPNVLASKYESPLVHFQKSSKELMSSTPISQKLETIKENHPQATPTITKTIEHELLRDIDLDLFDQPFSEEETLWEKAGGAGSSSSAKENSIKSLKDSTNPDVNRRSTSDLFALMDCKPLNTSIDFNRPQIASARSSFLAAAKKAKVETLESLRDRSKESKPANLISPLQGQLKSKAPTTCDNKTKIQKSSALHESPASPTPVITNCSSMQANAESPKNRPSTLAQPVEKSPSVFDMYLRNMEMARKRKENLTLPPIPHSAMATVTSSNQSSITPKSLERKNASKALTEAAAADDESLIFRRPLKRKLILSDSEDEIDDEKKENNNDDGDSGATTDCEVIEQNHSDSSDFESIPATQNIVRDSYQRPKAKRLRLNNFLDLEAAVSGDEDDDSNEDENDELLNSLASFVQDKTELIEEHPDAPSCSQMHAVYLKSIKSPQNHRGAFKIPQKRVFNDYSHIYSQAPPTQLSQYQCDSFIVNEADEDLTTANDASLCPLERAERILRNRRREKKRKFAEIAVVNKKKSNPKKTRKRIKNDTSSESDSN